MRSLLVVLVLLLSSPVAAQDSAAAARSAIQSQTDAIGRDDAATAYSYAAPAIQGLFTQPDVFMKMVQKSYAPIYRHRSFEFGEVRAADGKVAQKVSIVDSDGVAWDALYTLEQQSDGTMKITGCVLKKAEGQAV